MNSEGSPVYHDACPCSGKLECEDVSFRIEIYYILFKIRFTFSNVNSMAIVCNPPYRSKHFKIHSWQYLDSPWLRRPDALSL